MPLTSALPTNPLISNIPVGAHLYRSHWSHRDPVFFNRTPNGGRFNSPSGDFGVLYLAETIEGAFIEGLVYDLTLKEASGRVLSDALLTEKGLSLLQLSSPVRLLDITDHGLAIARQDLRLLGGPHPVSCDFAAQVYAHPTRFDGIRYPARHNPAQTCVALFERTRPVPTVVFLGAWVGPALLNRTCELMNRYQITRSTT